MKLLCIDSEPVYCEILSLCAKKENIQVKSVMTYDDAVSTFIDYAPDIITLDSVINGGNAFDLVKKIKALSGNRFVPVIFLSSHTSDSVMDQCFQSGADDFISKPFNEMLFSTRLKTHARHVALMKAMYRKNKSLTYYQTMIEREHQMAHQVLSHIQNRSEKNSEYLAITRLSAASFNGDLALAKTRRDNSRLIFVGDFTGHGLPASIGALPVAQAFFDAVDDLTPLEELVSQINKVLFNVLPDYMFCAGYLILISLDGKVEYWGGGMPNAFIRRDYGNISYLQCDHMPLGVLSSAEFESDFQTSRINTGDTLIVVSDGVLELKDRNEKMFGHDRVESLIKESYAQESLLKAQEETESKLSEYLGDSEQLDDITLVALRNTH